MWDLLWSNLVIRITCNEGTHQKRPFVSNSPGLNIKHCPIKKKKKKNLIKFFFFFLEMWGHPGLE